jgi:hypothetical protein
MVSKWRRASGRCAIGRHPGLLPEVVFSIRSFIVPLARLRQAAMMAQCFLRRLTVSQK